MKKSTLGHFPNYVSSVLSLDQTFFFNFGCNFLILASVVLEKASYGRKNVIQNEYKIKKEYF